MFAADAKLDVGAGFTAFLYGHLNQFANTIAVEHFEWIVFQNSELFIHLEELAGIVARVAKGHLSEVVCSKAEEFGRLGNLIGGYRCAGYFDHCTHKVFDAVVAFGKNSLGSIADDLFLHTHFCKGSGERNHDLGKRFDATGFEVECSFDDGTRLHLGDFGIGIAQAAAPVSEHGVELVKLFHLMFDLLNTQAHHLGHFLLTLIIVRNKLVQWRVEQTYGYGQTFHGFEDAFEVFALNWEQLFEGFSASGLVAGQNHLAHGHNFVAAKEHVLGTAQSDTLCTKATRHTCIMRSVGIGAHVHPRLFVGQLHEFAKIAAELRLAGFDAAFIYLASRAIQRNEVAFVEGDVAHGYCAVLIVNLYGTCARNTAFTHTAGHNSCVAGHTAAGSEDTLSHIHTLEVFGRGFDAHQHNFLTLCRPSFGFVSMEHDLSRGCSGRCGQAFGQHLGLSQSCFVEYGVKQLVETIGFNAQQGFVFADHALLKHFHGNANHRGTCALTVAGLQNPKLTFLNGKLKVLHIAVMVLQFLLKVVEFFVNFRKHFLERGIFGFAFFFADVLQSSPTTRAFEGNFLRGTDTGHYVFTLGIN